MNDSGSEKTKFQVWRLKILNVSFKTKYGDVLWFNVIVSLFLHAVALATLWHLSFAKWQTIAFAITLSILGGIGVTAGAHRLWCHRSYKARLPLRIFLAILQTTIPQRDIHWWCRDHRTHHKFVDTNADPYTASRGFFFSHIGWILVKKHPDVIAKGKTIDISDLEADPIIMFQHKYYDRLEMIIWTLNILTPVYFWNETINMSMGMAALTIMAMLHATASVNSFAHMFGSQPYDKNVTAKENRFVSLVALGEGYHNFHHAFPSDYATSEMGFKFNLSKYFILLEFLGLAYDLKTVSPEMVRKRALRTG